jgi:hypothetical protein
MTSITEWFFLKSFFKFMQKRHFFFFVPGNDKPWISLWCCLIWGARRSLKIEVRNFDCLEFDEISQKKCKRANHFMIFVRIRTCTESKKLFYFLKTINLLTAWVNRSKSWVTLKNDPNLWTSPKRQFYSIISL